MATVTRQRRVRRPDSSQKESPTPKVKASGKYLSRVSTAIESRPLAVIAYGPPGVGKTSLFANAPNAVFLIHKEEQGINDLKRVPADRREVPADVPVLPAVDSWTDLLGMLDELANNTHPYKWLIIDSLTWMEQLCFAHCCQKEFNNDWTDQGFYAFQRGPKVASSRHWPEFIRHLERVRDNGVNVVCLAHSKIKPFSNPEGPDYDRYIPRLERESFELLYIWSEIVGFMNYHVEIKADRGALKKKGTGGDQRFFYTEYTASYDAKNRLSLPPCIDMGTSPKEAWANFSEAVRRKD